MLGLPSLKDVGYLVLAALLAVSGGWLWGKLQYHRGAADQRQLNHTEVVLTQKISGQATKQIVTKYVTKTKVIHEKGQEIIKRIPQYISVEESKRCIIPNGFVSLWNAANEMQLPNPSSKIDEESSGVTLPELSKQHTKESTQYNKVREQLNDLIDWVQQQKEIYKTK